MSRNLNKVQLIGNVGRDPDIQTTSAGTKVAHVSLATSRRLPRGDEFEQRTEWHRLTLWEGLADIAADYVRRGDRVYVEGAGSSMAASSETISPFQPPRS